MQFLSLNHTVNFMKLRLATMVLSTVLILGSLVSLGMNSLNWGLDFTGGTLIEVGYEESADLEKIRAELAGADFEDAVVQTVGSSQDVLIRIAPREGVKASAIGDQVLAALREDGETVDMRFEWRFALGSVAALIHDVILTLGLFSVLQIEFDLTVLAAVLAVIGYSLNDTIVVCDRIRENFRKIRKGEPVEPYHHYLIDHGAGIGCAVLQRWCTYPRVCYGAAVRYCGRYLFIYLHCQLRCTCTGDQ